MSGNGTGGGPAAPGGSPSGPSHGDQSLPQKPVFVPPHIVAVLERHLDRISYVFKLLIAFALAIMVLLNLYNILSRSLLGQAYGWIFDWTMLLFVWMLLLGLYVYMRDRRDVVVDIFVSRLPALPRRIAGLFACAVSIAVMVSILNGAPKLLALQDAPMETIPLPMYLRSAPLFVSAALLLVHFALDFLCIACGWRNAFPRTDDGEAHPDAVEKGAVE